MKIMLNCFVLILFFITSAHAVSIDDLTKTVVFLRQQSTKMMSVDGKSAELYYHYPDSKEYKPIIETLLGTGFLINYNGRDYLVTAKHVAKGLSATGEIIINLTDGKTTILTFQALSQTNIIKGAHWFHHPKLDISIHPMAYSNVVDAISIPESLFPKKDKDVKLLTPAYVVGFPMGLGVLDKLSPVAKEAKLASRLTSIAYPDIPSDLHFYLLDQALSQGYSGAPVFYIEDIPTGATLHLLGVQSSALSDQTGGKMSVVVPISYVWDIFESPEFQTYIKALKLNK